VSILERLLGQDFISIVEQDALGNDDELYYRVSPSGGRELRVFMKKLGLKKSDKILDVGCGKGSALRTFSRLGFKEIAGIELSEEIAAIAQSNLKHIPNLRIFHGDVLDFRLLSNYNLFYLYNPFSHIIMEQFLKKLDENVFEHKIIYNNPKCADLLQKYHYSEILSGTNSWGGELRAYQKVI
jgi:SAM-dependent methyltransferase